MRLGIAGPLATSDIEHLLDGNTVDLPREMFGAPLLVTLIEQFLNMGHEVVAYTTDPQLKLNPPAHSIAHGKNLTVHYVPRRRRAFRPEQGTPGRMADLFALERRQLTQAIRNDPPDIVHAHWSYEFAAAAIDSGLPCLVTCHDSPNAILRAMPDLYRVGRWIMARKVLRQTKHATVVSPYLADELRGLLQTTPAVIPNPMPERLFSNGCPREGRDFDHQPLRIAMLLNGWTTLKNPVPGLEAMLQIQKRYPHSELHLFGPGYAANEEAGQWARKNACNSSFIFHGKVPNSEAIQKLRMMDLLLHPSIEESFGMTIGEAMALGIPVVAGANSGAVPWIMNGGVAGALVDVRSSRDISEAALNLLCNPNRYAEASRAGFTRARQLFSPVAVATQYQDRYHAILEQEK